MGKIETDYERWTWKICADPWRSSFKGVNSTNARPLVSLEIKPRFFPNITRFLERVYSNDREIPICRSVHHFKGRVIRATFYFNLSRKCCVCVRCKLKCVFVRITTVLQHVARSRHELNFVQNVAATCNTVVIRTKTHFNLQRNNVARQVERKCCPYYWALKKQNFWSSQTAPYGLLCSLNTFTL